MGLSSVLTRKHLSQSEKGGIICYEAGGEDQSCILLMQLGQLSLQTHMVVTGP